MLAPIESRLQPQLVQKCFLVGVHLPEQRGSEAANLLAELQELVRNLGLLEVGCEMVRLREPHSQLLIGSGKADELISKAKQAQATILVFDHELTPAQQHNWEKRSGLTVIDREEVILEIFARRAKTREARLQIGLAQMEYSLPRLTRAWAHLSRQRGATNLRGQGESQLEVDRRLVRKRIDRYRAELQRVRDARATQRKQRLRQSIPVAAIVGYTNAGKSSLMRALTQADVYVENQLFATLDPTTRCMMFADNTKLLITDTVGFIRKLPHRLIEAFKATLEEAVVSSFLIHVVDVSSPEVLAHYHTTVEVLSELGVNHKDMVTVFNKVDLVPDISQIAHLRYSFPQAHFVSVKTGQGMEALREKLHQLARPESVRLSLRLPHTRYDLLSQLHNIGRVYYENFTENGIEAEVSIPKRMAWAFQQYCAA